LIRINYPARNPAYRPNRKERAMIPTRYDYYKARAREHRRLAQRSAQDRAMHLRLVEAYGELARKYCLRQVVSLRIPAAA
jgi:hypothetical protein